MKTHQLEVDGVTIECSEESSRKERLLTIVAIRAKRISGNQLKKLQQAMRAAFYTGSVEIDGHVLACQLEPSASSLTLEKIVSPIASVINESGQSGGNSRRSDRKRPRRCAMA